MIEDRLSFDDTPGPIPSPVTPQPIPTPIPYPVPTPASTTTWAQRLQRYGPWVAIAILASALAWQMWRGKVTPTPGPAPTPTPVIDVTEAGKAWAKELPLTFADSFEKAQADVRGTDKPLDAIRKEHVERWKAARDSAFNARFERLFDQVIAPGNDKPTMEDRRRYAEMMGKIITGTREGAK